MGKFYKFFLQYDLREGHGLGFGKSLIWEKQFALFLSFKGLKISNGENPILGLVIIRIVHTNNNINIGQSAWP